MAAKQEMALPKFYSNLHGRQRGRGGRQDAAVSTCVCMLL
jgi:hypothetical protein